MDSNDKNTPSPYMGHEYSETHDMAKRLINRLRHEPDGLREGIAECIRTGNASDLYKFIPT